MRKENKMFRRNKKVIVTVIAILLVSTTIFAQPITKTIRARYGDVQLLNEGQNVTHLVNTKYDGAQAFISDSRTYVPIRAVADVLGINVQWDPNTRTASFTDTEKAQLRARVIELEKKIKELEDKPASSAQALKDLEAKLNKDFNEIDKVPMKYTITQNSKGELTINAYANITDRSDEERWNKTGDRVIKNTLEDIMKEVDKSFKDSDVKGTVYTESRYDKNKIQYEFDRKAGKSLNITDKTEGAKDDLRDKFKSEMTHAFKQANINTFVEISSFKVERDDYIKATVKLTNSLNRREILELQKELIESEDYFQRNYGRNYRYDIIFEYNNDSYRLL